jgi:DHA3 family macrolide efflux protein-like MFS transporter
LPTIFVGLIAGVFVDRYDRKRIMIWAEVIGGLFTLAIPFMISFNIGWLYVLLALSGVTAQFFEPARESILPEIATDAELSAANTLMSISSFGSVAIGFALAGAVAAIMPIEWGFCIDAFTYFFSALCVLLIRIPKIKADGTATVRTVFRNLRAGLSHVRHTDSLRSLFLVYFLVFIVFGVQLSTRLPFALQSLNSSEFEYSLIEVAEAVGFALGSLILLRFMGRLREGQWMTISLFGIALTSILYSVSNSVVSVVAWVLVLGCLTPPSVVGRSLIMQRESPREMRGRVLSAFFAVRDFGSTIGMLLAGLADVMDVRLLQLISAVLLLGLAIYSGLLPGLGQPALEWKRAMKLLRGVKAAPNLGLARAAAAADFDSLALHVPALNRLSYKDRQLLAAQTLVADAPSGTVILRKGEHSDAAYFIISGRAVAGQDEEGGYRLLSVMQPGDFFGEIAALTGSPRTANVVADEHSTLLQIPSATLKALTKDPAFHQLFNDKMSERLTRSLVVARSSVGGLDQRALQELRTPEVELN